MQIAINGQLVDLSPEEEAAFRAEQAALNMVDLVAYTAQKRWETEVGGITVAGLPVATDDRSKIMLSGARIKADSDPGFETTWKGPDGTFVTLNAETIIGLSDAVLDHVNNCFAIEADVLAQITAGTITEAAEIDVAFA